MPVAGWPRPAGPTPIDLATVLRLAGASSLEVASVREKVHAAYAKALQADVAWWPTFGPELTWKRHDGDTQATGGEFVDVAKQSVFVGYRARLRWQVGEAIFSSLAARQRLEGSRAGLAASEAGAALDAGLAYLDLLREHARARMADRSAEVTDRLRAEIEEGVNAGRGFQGDVLRAKTQADLARVAAQRAREAAGQARIRLQSLLRLSSDVQIEPAEEALVPLGLVPETAKEPEWVRIALSERPEMASARAEFAASRREEEGAVWGPLVPDLTVDYAPGRFGRVASEGHSTEDAVATLSWRIGAGGLFDRGRAETSSSRLRAAEIDLARVEQRIVDQVRTAYAQWQSRREEVRLAESAVRSAEELLRLDRERFARGIGLPLEVLQAEDALNRARQEAATAIIGINQAELRLLYSAGSSADRGR
ncbi:MAG: TolC family protein [Planctomycetes bacterium]|nr:TolC family protein [Planctomycetota bacterium]